MAHARKSLYEGDRSPEAIAFLNELVEVSRKHGFVLMHEDGHGGFIVERRASVENAARMEAWLLDASEEERI